MLKRWPDVASGGLLIIVSLIFWSQTQSGAASGLDIANDAFWFPRLLIGLLILASALLVMKGLFRGQPDDERPILPTKPLRLLLVVMFAAAYCLLFEQVGFLPLSLALIVLMCLATGYRSVGVVVLFAVFFVSALWLVFDYGFDIRPPGIGLDDLFNAIVGASNG